MHALFPFNPVATRLELQWFCRLANLLGLLWERQIKKEGFCALSRFWFRALSQRIRQIAGSPERKGVSFEKEQLTKARHPTKRFCREVLFFFHFYSRTPLKKTHQTKVYSTERALSPQKEHWTKALFLYTEQKPFSKELSLEERALSKSPLSLHWTKALSLRKFLLRKEH